MASRRAISPPVPQLSERAKRNLRFFLAAGLGSLLVFLVLGFYLTSAKPEWNGFLLAMLVGPVVGVGAARLRYGWPRFETREGNPLVPPEHRPYLFFAIMPAIAALVYVVLGVYLTPVFDRPDLVPYVSFAVGVVGGSAAAYALVGFPRFWRPLLDAWRRVPPETRPWTFFLVAPVLAFFFFMVVGLALTAASNAVATLLPIEAQPLVALPVALLAGAGAAYLLVGVPKPARPVREYVPDVPGRLRPAAFAVTWFLVAVPCTLLAGWGLSYAPRLSDAVLVPAALLLGLTLALGATVLAWGTPRRWRRYPDYTPGVPEPLRVALLLPVAIATVAVGGVASAAAGFDLFPGLVLGGLVGLPLGLAVSGILPRLVRAARGRARGGELPDMVKPLVLFPTWFLVAAGTFMLLAYAFPQYGGAITILSVALGLLVAIAMVEAGTWREWRARRREARARAREARRRRKEALAGAPAGKKA